MFLIICSPGHKILDIIPGMTMTNNGKNLMYAATMHPPFAWETFLADKTLCTITYFNKYNLIYALQMFVIDNLISTPIPYECHCTTKYLSSPWDSHIINWSVNSFIIRCYFTA